MSPSAGVMSEGIPNYDELKLRLDKEEATGSYRVLAFAPDGRTGRGTFVPPFTDDELDDFVRGVGLARRTRHSPAEPMEKAKSFGSDLFVSVMKEQVGEVYQAARAAAQVKDRGLRITLCLSGAPELMRLPWEFLYRRPRFLSQSIRTPLVRSLDLETARPPRKLELPLRILGMVSSPAGYEELDAAEERRKLENALSRLRDAGLVELHWLERATLAQLERRIAEPDEIHVLHYIGHGAYDEATERGIVVLEGGRGRPHDVSGEDLGSMLQDEESLRLVVLNSCEGARTSHVDPFSGATASLVEFEIPAVIGMQFEITDEAAIAFSDRLYTALAQGFPVDAALAQARRAIVAAGKETEFGTPVLFLRATDARLFEIEQKPAEPLPTIEQEPVKPPPTPQVPAAPGRASTTKRPRAAQPKEMTKWEAKLLRTSSHSRLIQVLRGDVSFVIGYEVTWWSGMAKIIVDGSTVWKDAANTPEIPTLSHRPQADPTKEYRVKIERSRTLAINVLQSLRVIIDGEIVYDEG